jgi:biopolymer transport protein TolR
MRQRRLKNEINVVPYIDVMLVLLVIFMVATPMMSTGEVKLPTSGAAAQKPDVYLRVQIEKNGALSVSSSVDPGSVRRLASVEELGKILGAEQVKDVLVAADEAVQYGEVVKALEVIKELGPDRVGLETSGH